VDNDNKMRAGACLWLFVVLTFDVGKSRRRQEVLVCVEFEIVCSISNLF
jgi:hypothetical protein